MYFIKLLSFISNFLEILGFKNISTFCFIFIYLF
ncbi:MAG: AgrD family cyclic lactone autoinducer peptide [Mycoplasma sp.]